MNSTPCGLDVCAFVQKIECTSDSTSPKLVISPENKINIFQDEISLEAFKYDNICLQDLKTDTLESLSESITKDVVESINRIMFVYKFGETHAVDMMTFCTFVLNNMCAAVNSEKPYDLSLHVSCLEVYNDGIIDLMQKSYTASNDLKVFELANQTGNNLIERIVTNAEDVNKITEVVFQKNTPSACPDCRHTIVLSTILLKTRNFDGFELMKTGRFILVDIGVCIHFLKEVTNYISSRRESFYLISDASSMAKDPKFWNCSLSGILMTFLSKSKMSIMMTLPSTLFDLEHVHALEIISEMQNLRLKPAINEKLILRESLKDYADEIKALEKDLSVLKNNDGILINQQKYRSLKNRLLLSETQLRDFHEEQKVLSHNLSMKKEILSRLQQEINLINDRIEEEIQKLKVSNITLEKSEQEKISLNLKLKEKVDACVSMNNMTNFNRSCTKNQNIHLVKMKRACEKCSSSGQLLCEKINSHTMNATSEQSKLKDKIESMLSHFHEILLNATMQQKIFILNANEFYLKFEEILKLWNQHCTNLIVYFRDFVGGILHNSFSLKNDLSTEFVSLNIAEGAIIEIMKTNKPEILNTIMSCSVKIQWSVENSIKLLYEFLCLLEIIQGKVKEQLKKLESTICFHINERMKFLNSTNSTMASMQQYFNAHLNLSSKINSDIFIHHQELKQSVNQDCVQIKGALNSLKKLFCIQHKFVADKWQQKQTYLSNIKEIGGVSESLQQCSEEYPILLDKLRQQCVSSIDDLHSILRDRTATVENLTIELKQMFYEIEYSIEDFSKENKKRVTKQENDIRDNLGIQNETIEKFMKITRSLVEEATKCITGGLQDTRISFLNVKDLKKNNDINHIILELRNKLSNYIRNYANILRLNELTLKQLPEAVIKQTENLEETIEFNHEEFLSSTPSSSHERSKNILSDKTKFLSRLGQIATEQVNNDCSSNLSVDQESVMNASILSLPCMSTGIKVYLFYFP